MPEMKAFTDFLELWSSDLLLAVVVLGLSYILENYCCIYGIQFFFVFIIICTNGWTKMYCCTTIPIDRATQYIVEKRWTILLWIAKTERCSVVQKFISYTLAVEVITLFKIVELDFPKISVHEFSMTQALRSGKKLFLKHQIYLWGENHTPVINTYQNVSQ